MSETGVVKFTCEHVRLALPPFPGMADLNECRTQLRARGWIGVDRQGIGFGNLSVRDRLTSSFYITGSGTGASAQLVLGDFAKVTAYDFDRNWLRCEGETVASSESLTHAAVYEADATARAVIHCHSAHLWGRLAGGAPTTAEEIEYGTPAMAGEVRRLFATTDLAVANLLVMGGHEDGIVAFGPTMGEALRVLIEAAL